MELWLLITEIFQLHVNVPAFMPGFLGLFWFWVFFSEKMLAVYFDCPGGPENLYVKEVMKPQPGEGEVLVKVSASALNRADIVQVCLMLS